MASVSISDLTQKYTLKLTCRIAAEQDETTTKYLPFSASATDLRRWHLISEGESGRVEWKYLDTASHEEQDMTSRFFLKIPIVNQSQASKLT